MKGFSYLKVEFSALDTFRHQVLHFRSLPVSKLLQNPFAIWECPFEERQRALAAGVHTPGWIKELTSYMSSTVTNSVSSLVQSIGEIPPEAVVFGQSEVMQALRSRLDKVASANVPVLIHGESGTGKDIIARLVHTPLSLEDLARL